MLAFLIGVGLGLGIGGVVGFVSGRWERDLPSEDGFWQQ